MFDRFMFTRPGTRGYVDNQVDPQKNGGSDMNFCEKPTERPGCFGKTFSIGSNENVYSPVI